MFPPLFQHQVSENFPFPPLSKVPSVQRSDYQQFTQILKDKLFFVFKNKNMSLYID